MSENAPTPVEAWDIHVSKPIRFPSGNAVYPVRVLCGDSYVGELVLGARQLRALAVSLGLEERPGAAVALGVAAPAPRFAPRRAPPVADRERLVDRVGGGS